MPNPSTTPPKLETPLNTFYESHFDTILFVVLVVSLLFILITSIRNFCLVARVHKENQTPGMIQHSVKIGWLGIELTPFFPPHASAFREAKPDLLEGLKGTLTNPPKDKNEKDPKDKDDKVQSPLDQFTILPLMDIQIGKLYFSFTNPSLFMLLTLSLVLLFLYFVTKKGGGKSVPNAWQSLVELLYSFVLNLVNEQIGGQSGKQKFFPCISVTLTFLLFCNLQGMIPYSFTVTSHFLITLGLSFSLFIGITLVGFARNGLHFLSFSLPAGVPLPLAPFLVLLELIPYSFRALSLGIRLFANMMAGHSLVKILSGFAWTMLCMGDPLYFIGDLGPLLIVLALTGLELGVAILQAYVFTILICIYLNDAINLH